MHTRILSLLLLSLVLAVPAAAQPRKPKPHAHPAAAASNAPREIAKFEDWTAATHQEGGQTVCYALTRAQSSAPGLPGRGEVVLTVTERQAARDTVAIEAGFDYAKDASVTVQVDQTGLDFFTRARDAYARDGKAAVAAFQKGARAIARSPGPRGQPVTDTFSLKGFSAAYAAIVKACPPPKG
ncbi:MAG TPA: invasion associated locus B family protein [Acetobacteraceae bacterium]|nr:invasion associated locus B family protein [Acetobacteraceae bacterium]